MKKLLTIMLALVMVLSMAACGTAPETETTGDAAETTGETTAAQTEQTGTLKRITVTVVHADGSSKDFAYETDAELLGDYLEQQGLIQSQGADDGMFHTVDGEKADWNENKSYWSLYLGEEYAMVGIYDTPITDGAVYKLVYTRG